MPVALQYAIKLARIFKENGTTTAKNFPPCLVRTVEAQQVFVAHTKILLNLKLIKVDDNGAVHWIGDDNFEDKLTKSYQAYQATKLQLN